MSSQAKELASAAWPVAVCCRFRSEANSASPANAANSAAPAYQPDFQLVFLLVERLIEVNLYSIPTLMAKFTSYCEYDKVGGGR